MNNTQIEIFPFPLRNKMFHYTLRERHGYVFPDGNLFFNQSSDFLRQGLLVCCFFFLPKPLQQQNPWQASLLAIISRPRLTGFKRCHSLGNATWHSQHRACSGAVERLRSACEPGAKTHHRFIKREGSARPCSLLLPHPYDWRWLCSGA